MSVFCKFCGHESASITALTSAPCSRSPNKRHQPYTGSNSSKPVCCFCGHASASITALTSAPCSKSPNKRHQPV